jgi:hypothetical protein
MVGFPEVNIPNSLKDYTIMVVNILRLYDIVPTKLVMETLAISNRLFGAGTLSSYEKTRITKIFKQYVL